MISSPEGKMNKISRRMFLSRVGGVTVAASVSPYVEGPATLAKGLEEPAVGPDIHFPTAPRDRIAVSSWPFRAYVESPTNPDRNPKLPGMDLVDFAAHVVKEFNIRNIEPIFNQFRSTDPQYLSEFRGAVEKAGSHVVDIPVDSDDSLYDPDPAVRKRAVEFGKMWVDIAVTIGSPGIRNGIARAKNASPNVSLAADGLSRIVDYAAQRNIMVTLENDDLVSEDAFFVVKVIEKVNSPYLRALPDFCNSMLSGNAAFDYRAITAMFHHAYNICHVKRTEVGDNGKLYEISLSRTFGILKASHFRGYCSMEWEGIGDPYAGVRKLISETMEYLA
jgi:sugar phosphate isomerase/epimerase